MKRKKYDLIFSLGEACLTATFLKKLSLRAMSTPFDWIAGGTFEKRVDFLETPCYNAYCACKSDDFLSCRKR